MQEIRHRPLRKLSTIKIREFKTEAKVINDIVADLQRKMKANVPLYDIPFIASPEMILLVFYALEKPSKSKDDIVFISHYLSSILQIEITLNSRKADVTDILYKLSRRLEIERHRADKIICRYGEYGDKFYFILKGSVAIIYKKEMRVKMTVEEYYSHLDRLIALKEFYLAEDIIYSNPPQYQKDGLFKLIDDEKKKYTLKLKAANRDSEKEELLNCVSVDDYIKQSFPISAPKANEYEGVSLTLFVYYFVGKLGVGEKFGDLALKNFNQKRTATIISNDKCLFGSLTKEIYDNLIKDIQEKIRKANITTVLTSQIFEGIRIESFVAKYFNCFKEFQSKQGSSLFHQGDNRQHLYFIKEGEIEISMRLSIHDLAGVIKSKKGFINERKESKLFSDISLNKDDTFFTKKNTFKVIQMKEKEIVGLDDFIDVNEQYFASAVFTSHNCIFFSIQYHIFKQILEHYPVIKRNLPLYLNNKNALILERLTTLRNLEINNHIKLFTSSSENLMKTLRKSSTDKNITLNKAMRVSSFTHSQFKKKGKSVIINDYSPGQRKKNGINTYIDSLLNKKKIIFRKLSKKQLPKESKQQDSSKQSKEKLDIINSYNFNQQQLSLIQLEAFNNNDSLNQCIGSRNMLNDNKESPEKRTVFYSNQCKFLSQDPLTLNHPSNLERTESLPLSPLGSSKASPHKTKIKEFMLPRTLSALLDHSSQMKTAFFNRLAQEPKSKKEIITAIDKKFHTQSHFNLNNNKSKAWFFQNFSLSTIDCLAMDKIYESLEHKKPKKYHPRSILPFNLLTSQKHYIHQIRHRLNSNDSKNSKGNRRSLV